MAENETRVRYKAIADFSALSRSVRNAKKAIKELRDEEAKLNAQSAAGQTKVTGSVKEGTTSRRRHKAAVDEETNSVRKSVVTFLDNADAVRESTKAVDANTEATNKHAASSSRARSVLDSVNAAIKRKSAADAEGSRSSGRHARETDNSTRAMGKARDGAEKLHFSFKKLGNWRPKLTPPFIALVPTIAAVLGLINPLVAGLGAAGAAALALGSSLASGLGGAIVGIIPGISVLIGLVASLKTAFGGIGNAFKAFGKMKKATGGGGGGGGGQRAKQELTAAEKLARAQQRYADATRDVLWAQEDLDDARKGYLKRLRDLQKAVDRIALSEARAAANSQLARENYANVLADPGSTKGQKMDAQVGVAEAQEEFNDLLERNVELREDLDKTQKDGVDGDRQVLQAQRSLTQAIWAQRDAQLALANEMSGSNEAVSAGAGAVDEYANMLAKLSPSARKFVEAIVAMSDRWDLLRRNVQESFFSEVIGDLELIPRLFDPIESMLSDIAGAAGRVFSSFIKLVTSTKWLNDIVLFGKQAAPIVELIGDGLLSLLDVFRDVTMASMPFFTAMSEGFKEGSRNLATLVEDARNTGSLAAWLEKSRQKLSQWWQIIKNIGGTLFNYSAAAEDFGGWMLDGFEKITEGWLSASKAARQEGSPFREYLEEIKPLLTEVKGLFADFFRWFAKESMDSENISGFTDIIKSLREDFGPALSDLLNTMAKSGVGDKFIQAVTKIIEVINSLFESGAGTAVTAFFDTMNALLDVLKFLVSIPGVGALIGAIATGFAAIAAVSFVGKFTGLTSLLGLLLRASKGGAVSKLLSKLGGFVGIGAKFAPGSRRGPGGGAEKLGGRGGNFLGNLGKRAAGGVGKGGLIGAIAAIVGGTILEEMVRDDKGGARDTAADIGGGVLNGAGMGALAGGVIGSIVPGVGNVVGAAAGGVIGGVVGGAGAAAGIDEKQWNKTSIDIALWWQRDVVKPLSDFSKSVGTWWKTNVETPLSDFATSVGMWWTENVTTPFNAFIGAAQRGWDQMVIQPLSAFSTAVGNWWKTNVETPLSSFAISVGTWWKTNVEAPLSSFAVSVGGWWQANIQGPLSAFAWNVGNWWQANIQGPLSSFANSVGGWWKANVEGPLGAFAWNVGAWWRANVEGPLGHFASSVGGWWKTNVETPFNNVINGIGRAWKDFLNFDLSSFLTKTFSGMFGGATEKKHNGGPIRRANGGGVPGSGNSDTVSAMLTPGEFVLRKSIVSQVGEENLAKLNAGIMSYAELMRTAMANAAGPAKPKQDSGIFLNGGGLVPGMPTGFGGPGSQPPPGGFAGAPGSGGTNITFGDINVYNPKPEPASDSLPRSIRKATYLAETSR